MSEDNTRRMPNERPTAIVYIDGLNLDRQLLDRYPEHKWLDLVKLCQLLLPSYEVKQINYYTSRLRSIRPNGRAPNNQDAYLFALQSLVPTLNITFGKIISRDKLYPQVPLRIDYLGDPVLAKVRVTQEKGSDVALASQMVFDAMRSLAELYVLVSNDSDFEPTLRLIHSHVNAKLAILSPSHKPSPSLLFSKELVVRTIRDSVLAASQLPDVVVVGGNRVSRPSDWLKSRTP